MPFALYIGHVYLFDWLVAGPVCRLYHFIVAINQLKNATPGTFLVRDSNSFPGAFGLAVRVAQLPANVHIKHGQDPAAEYVRFYLIEPTAKGVKLKGCSNEPVFGKSKP